MQRDSSALSRSRKYNILKIAPTSFFADYGCHVRIYEETRILQKMGHRVNICAYSTGRNIAGINIHRARGIPWNNEVQVGSSADKPYCDILLSLKSMEMALRLRPDLIHAHLHEGALIGYWISRLLRIPLVFDFQGSLTSEMLDHKFIKRESLAFKPLRLLEIMIDYMADVVITSSANATEMLAQQLSRSRKWVFTIADSVDTDFFRPRWEIDRAQIAQLRAKLGIPSERKVVVYLGLLAEYQGTGKLLQAAACLIQRGLPVHFLIMGFPGEAYYRSIALEMGISDYITFTGKVPYPEAPRYMAIGDVAVSPKMSETEGNGKLLNYMAVGLPTITFDTPVASEILGELGIYARVGDAQDLAEKIQYILCDEAYAQELSRHLRDKAENLFSWDKSGERLVRIYDLVCGKSNHLDKQKNHRRYGPFTHK